VTSNSAIKPISPYGWHKYQSELICKEYFECFGVQSVILRVFSVYGPNLKKQILWDLYSKCCKEPENVVLHGTGNESRDFIHIYDFVKAVECIVYHDSFSATAINVANGKQVYIKEVADYFVKYFKSTVKISFNGIQRKGDPANWLADINDLKSYGYERTIEIEQGIQSYIEWLKELK
jgi:dTDP-glucose 4,6-dehydratase/UDP-glucose 4-epimerase